jgi:hypothetical protein
MRFLMSMAICCLLPVAAVFADDDRAKPVLVLERT